MVPRVWWEGQRKNRVGTEVGQEEVSSDGMFSQVFLCIMHVHVCVPVCVHLLLSVEGKRKKQTM